MNFKYVAAALFNDQYMLNDGKVCHITMLGCEDKEDVEVAKSFGLTDHEILCLSNGIKYE